MFLNIPRPLGCKYPLIFATTLAHPGVSTICSQIRASQACRVDQLIWEAAVVVTFPKFGAPPQLLPRLMRRLGRFLRERVVVVVLPGSFPKTTSEHGALIMTCGSSPLLQDFLVQVLIIGHNFVRGILLENFLPSVSAKFLLQPWIL